MSRARRAARIRAAMPIVDKLMAHSQECDKVWWARKDSDAGELWLTTPFSVNPRGDDALAESNYEVIQTDIDRVAAFGIDYRVDLWPGGSIQTLQVRADDALALRQVERWVEALRDYPVADEMHYSALEWERNHPNPGECYAELCSCTQDKEISE